MTDFNRRGFLRCLTGLIAAPAVVPFASLMPVRGIIMPIQPKLYDIRLAPFDRGVSWWRTDDERAGRIFKGYLGSYNGVVIREVPELHNA